MQDPRNQRSRLQRTIRLGRHELGSREWMMARLRRTLIFAVGMLVLHGLATASHRGPSLATETPRAETRVASSSSSHAIHSEPRAVPPVGWRRTAQGWQHVSTWTKHFVEKRSIHDHILAQRQSESAWGRCVMASIRSIPPGCFAMMQLMLVGGVALITLFQRRLSGNHG